ncbi:MltA domain-containing protein [Paludibacterium denitrificans]|uniref:MltA domain-containing protein n=1 Tax=Paludibacterium denitrificans TaxID=2675226 RepID=UPI001E45CFBA|nr:MltA domain-containing protein [Paludibacterium denitrificans]
MRDGAGDSGLITGYYEPLLSGSRVRSERTPYPLYGVPADLVTVDFPAAARGKALLVARRVSANRLALVMGADSAGPGQVEIHPADFVVDNRTSLPRAAWLATDCCRITGATRLNRAKGWIRRRFSPWVEDPVELFFLQVQGSGRIQLEDGSFLHVGYADQNGYGYQSIGKWLVEQGELTLANASMQGIQDWIKAHPQRQQELFNVNPSYVFFKPLRGDDSGPIGSLGVPLTGGYSIAVDPKYIPLGTPVYLVTTGRCHSSRWRGWCMRKIPAGRFVARCVPISSGAMGPKRACTPGA